jgi:tRNA (guanine37-N1)-methyltransferase
MRFDVLTLFPELFGPHLSQGVTRRAFGANRADSVPPLQVELWSLRDFALDNYRRVDDRPYGGGPGMVMLAQPIERALEAIRAARCEVAPAESVPVIHFSPTGRRMDQALVRELAAGQGAVLLCGRYEGIDQRVIDRHVDLELSLGDFVLSGGELPALALLDAVARLQDGVLGDAQSHQQDSFSEGLLDCPHYSRPERLPSIAHPREAFAGARSSLGDDADAVPSVLMSGNHAAIARWRRERSLERTARWRPDLLEVARRNGQLTREDERFLMTVTQSSQD